MKLDTATARDHAGRFGVALCCAMILALGMGPGTAAAIDCDDCVRVVREACVVTDSIAGQPADSPCDYTDNATTILAENYDLEIPIAVSLCSDPPAPNDDSPRYLLVTMAYHYPAETVSDSIDDPESDIMVQYDCDGDFTLGNGACDPVDAEVLESAVYPTSFSSTENTKAVAVYGLGINPSGGAHLASEPPATGAGGVVRIDFTKAHEVSAAAIQLCGVAVAESSDPTDSFLARFNSTTFTINSNVTQMDRSLPAAEGAMMFDSLAVDAGDAHSPSAELLSDTYVSDPDLAGVAYEDFMAQTWRAGDATMANICTHSVRVSEVTNATFGDQGIGRNQQYLVYDVNTNSAAWAMVALNPFFPTAAELGSVEVLMGELRNSGRGALLQWQTTAEADTLGFNLYREGQQGRRTLVNDGLIAGSALRYATDRLAAGYSYAWFDGAGRDDSRYWIEEIETGGRSQLFGPFTVSGEINGAISVPISPRLSEVAATVNSGDAWRRQQPVRDQVMAGDTKAGRRAAQKGIQWNLASMPAAKLLVTTTGWHRVTFAQLAAAGFDVSGLDLDRLQLFADGSEVGRRITADAVEFFGVAKETSYADGRVYWLVEGDGAGALIPFQQSQIDAANLLSFTDTIELRERISYVASALNGDAETNFYGQVVVNGVDASHTIRVDRPDPAAIAAPSLAVALANPLSTDHQVRVDLNGATAGFLTVPAGSSATETLALPPGALLEGDNTVDIVSISGGGASFVDFVRITYDRLSTAADDRIDVLLPPSHGTAPLRIDGFTTSDVRAFDVTNPLRPVELEAHVVADGPGWAADLRLSATRMSVTRSGARVFAATGATVTVPEITVNRPSSWHSEERAADYVILAHRDLFAALEPLAALRKEMGHSVALIDVADVYDEFSYGSKSPDAIRDLLTRAAVHWKERPRYVVLAGLGTYDPRGYHGVDLDLVPTKLFEINDFETASDTWFLSGDPTEGAGAVIGRLPVTTVDQAVALVDKLVAYEMAPPRLDRAVLVADKSKGRNFTVMNDELAAVLPVPTETISASELGFGGARAEILAAFQAGAPFVHYAGHGMTTEWRQDMLMAADAPNLGNGEAPAFVSAMTCLNGAFQDLNTSLSEALVLEPVGGAIGFLGSTSTSDPTAQVEASEAFVRAALGGAQTYGDALRTAMLQATLEARATTVLIGDPATRIVR